MLYRTFILLAIFFFASPEKTVHASDPDQRTTPHHFKIGTGAAGEDSFAVGSLIAAILSYPAGSRPCHKGGSCGIPGTIGQALSAEESAQNVLKLAVGDLDAALIRLPVLQTAAEERGIFTGMHTTDKLAALACLFSETLHLMVKKDSPVEHITDLIAHHIAVGRPESGTRLAAERILAAAGLGDGLSFPLYLAPDAAIEALKADKIDALFHLGSPPDAALMAAMQTGQFRFIPIPKEILTDLEYAALTPSRLPADTYPDTPAIDTFSSYTILVTNTKKTDSEAYGLLTSLWHDRNRTTLLKGSPAGRNITEKGAFCSLPIPFHPGAKKFYMKHPNFLIQ